MQIENNKTFRQKCRTLTRSRFRQKVRFHTKARSIKGKRTKLDLVKIQTICSVQDSAKWTQWRIKNAIHRDHLYLSEEEEVGLQPGRHLVPACDPALRTQLHPAGRWAHRHGEITDVAAVNHYVSANTATDRETAQWTTGLSTVKTVNSPQGNKQDFAGFGTTKASSTTESANHNMKAGFHKNLNLMLIMLIQYR